jgi:hypothetical protein
MKSSTENWLGRRAKQRLNCNESALCRPHSLALAKGRWFLSAPLNSVNASKDAAAKAREWLVKHEFPAELSEAFEGSTYFREKSWRTDLD